MTTKCPICGSDAAAFPRTGDLESFDCPQHFRGRLTKITFRKVSAADIMDASHPALACARPIGVA
jgi:hypothetical protein